jgi:hypothetical protein
MNERLGTSLKLDPVLADGLQAMADRRQRRDVCSDCGSGPHDNWLNCRAQPGEDCPGMRIVVIDRRAPWDFRKLVRALVSWLKPKLGTRPVAFRVKAAGGWMYFDDEETAQLIAGDRDYQGLYVRDGDRR